MTATNPTQHCYRPIHKPNQLLIGTGQTAVGTGWTVKQAIAKHLQQDEYAAIGQLYSPTRGINLLIRNLLANPRDYADPAGSFVINVQDKLLTVTLGDRLYEFIAKLLLIVLVSK